MVPSDTEIFEGAFPYYLAIGMTYEDFWERDPRVAISYRKAQEIRQELANQNMWLQGLYNYKAVSAAVAALAHGLNGGKGKKPDGYVEYPFALTEREKEAEKQRKIKHTLEWIEKSQREQYGRQRNSKP